ncbi:MAG: uroporphyrinogen decarboxylase [Lachnospiraceae bacterium]|nr:uroporphyrinogen decarboxylase [Lachnospiraceae bacterium]
MLTIKENFIETIKGGHPDRFVKQFEYIEHINDPILFHCGDDCEYEHQVTNDWGITFYWPTGAPGPMPRHDSGYKLLNDISDWRDYIKAPDPHQFPESEWEEYIAIAEKIDRKQKFVGSIIGNGIFEKMHSFMGVENAMMCFYEEPEDTHDLIEYLTDWYLECIPVQASHMHPDIVFQHDDWGSQKSLFFTPEIFEEFMLPAYEKMYACWRENGAQVIVHHSDSYAAELVPYMIKMGVDVFQGAVSDNNIPELLKKYEGKISIHAGLDNGKFDCENWSKEAIYNELDKLFQETNGGKYLIPGLTQGAPGSTYPGVYEYVDDAIELLSDKYFSEKK